MQLVQRFINLIINAILNSIIFEHNFKKQLLFTIAYKNCALGNMNHNTHRQISFSTTILFRNIALLLILLFFGSSIMFAQTMGRISGTITNTIGEPVPYANISVAANAIGTSSSIDGKYQLLVPAVDSVQILFSSLGYSSKTITIKLKANEKKQLDILLETDLKALEAVSIIATQKQFGNIERIEHRDIKFIPNASGSFEAILKSMPGVASANELSSQYSVRGGNFDENLVYVNDVEIYRPFLIRSGQQEGLSFVNSDMVESVEFSAGGFNAEFGDKMSSVLNIRYRKPTTNAAKAEMSLLGTSALAEGSLFKGQFTHLTGVRYKTSQYLLGTLDDKGDYNPSFIDVQSNLTWKLSNSFQLTFLGNFARNNYHFVPQTRETRFGTFTNALQLKVFYEGQELNRFETMQTSLGAEYRPSEELFIKISAGNYLARESETFDVFGQYLLNELDNSLGSSTYGDSLINVGIGGFMNHARNFLDANFSRVEHIGSYVTASTRLKWGLRFQHELIDDEISEWELIDSSGYSIPYNAQQLNLSYSLKSKNTTSSKRYSGFIQESIKFSLASLQLSLTAGVRLAYWDLNKQMNFSPRASILGKFEDYERVSFHLSGGYYHQPPIYKEIRTPQGTINKNAKAQESVHIVVGSEYQFESWNRPFKFQAEIYYKELKNIIPYKIENVRIRYAGENIAVGYAQGIDLKINGEFVKDAQSWASLSYMQTFEDIANDSYVNNNGETVYPGYYARPTDQRIGVGVFFQDYLPNRPNIRVHLSGHYGTGLPFTFPKTERYDLINRMPSYKRVDMGFTAILKEYNHKSIKKLESITWLKSLWFGAEIFNLFDFSNTVSYLWVQTVGNQSNQAGLYAVPNYLTSRRINVKLTASF
jgi:hypothetical protein